MELLHELLQYPVQLVIIGCGLGWVVYGLLRVTYIAVRTIRFNVKTWGWRIRDWGNYNRLLIGSPDIQFAAYVAPEPEEKLYNYEGWNK